MRILVVAFACAGCGGMMPEGRTCESGRELVDNICVSYAAADFISCIRSRGQIALHDKRGRTFVANATIAGQSAATAVEAKTALDAVYGSETSSEERTIIDQCAVLARIAEFPAAPIEGTRSDQGPAAVGSGDNISDVDVIDGKWNRVGAIIRGRVYKDAVYLPEEKLVIRHFKKYRRLTGWVGVDDSGGLRGRKRFWIKNQHGNALFEGLAEPSNSPVPFDVDISNTDWIEFTAYDLNGQPRDFVRWIGLRFQ